jgi:hypothetical protein
MTIRAITPTGRLMKKIHRQERSSVNRPPRIGPPTTESGRE